MQNKFITVLEPFVKYQNINDKLKLFGNSFSKCQELSYESVQKVSISLLISDLS